MNEFFTHFSTFVALSLSRAPFSWATHDDVAERERAKVSSSAKDIMLYNPAFCMCGWGESNSRSSSRISPRETIENNFFLRILNRERGVCISRNDNIKLHNDTLQVGRSHSLSPPHVSSCYAAWYADDGDGGLACVRERYPNNWREEEKKRGEYKNTTKKIVWETI